MIQKCLVGMKKVWSLQKITLKSPRRFSPYDSNGQASTKLPQPISATENELTATHYQTKPTYRYSQRCH